MYAYIRMCICTCKYAYIHHTMCVVHVHCSLVTPPLLSVRVGAPSHVCMCCPLMFMSCPLTFMSFPLTVMS